MAANLKLSQFYPARKHTDSSNKENELPRQPSLGKKSPSLNPDYLQLRECERKYKLGDEQKYLGYLPAVPYREAAERTWVYPGSKGFRQYQFLICRTCLYFNTLVCLPTGLGKTFIAATVMYNFCRWFTEGYSIFLAPTKPLVDQQYWAFSDYIKGFDKTLIGQLTGKQSKPSRISSYKKARILFMTPQTLANDLRKNLVDRKKITCIVFDEAHRATGNYAYTQIIKFMEEEQAGFRIVALSATPGSNVDMIQQIVTNLRIAKIEARTEEDPDVKLYTHQKRGRKKNIYFFLI